MDVMIRKLVLAKPIYFLLTLSDNVHWNPVVKAYPLDYFEADVALSEEAISRPTLVVDHHLFVLQ